VEDELEVVLPAWLRSGSSRCLEADAMEDELEVAPSRCLLEDEPSCPSGLGLPQAACLRA
jgi:hypothetical protein